MAENTDPLFDLIHALSPKEKWRFKKFAGRFDQKSSKNYVKLFDVIAKQKVYNEEKIIKRFKNESLINQLAVSKNYLYNIILKSLVEYEDKLLVEKEVNLLLHSVDLLFHKGLFKQAQKQLNKAQKLISKHGMPTKAMESMLKEQNIITYTIPAHLLTKRYDEVNDKLTKKANYFLTERNYVSLLRKCMNIHYLYGQPRNYREFKKYLEVYDHPLVQKEPHKDLHVSMFCYLNLNANYYELLGDYENALKFHKKLLIINEKKIFSSNSNSYSKEIHVLNYINVLFSFLSNSVKANQTKTTEFNAKLKALKGYSDEAKYVKNISEKAFIYYVIVELERCLNQKNDNKGEDLLKIVVQQYDKGQITGSTFEYQLLVSLIMYCFYNELYEDALHWINKANSYQDARKVEGYYGWFNIMALIIHFELDNGFIIDYTIKNTYRYLSKRKRLFKTEKRILDFFRNEIKHVYTEKELQIALEKLYNNLKVLKKDKYEKYILEEFDIFSWLESRIEGKTLPEIRERKK